MFSFTHAGGELDDELELLELEELELELETHCELALQPSNPERKLASAAVSGIIQASGYVSFENFANLVMSKTGPPDVTLPK